MSEPMPHDAHKIDDETDTETPDDGLGQQETELSAEQPAGPFAHVNVADLAETTGLSRHHLHKVLRGRAVPGADIILKVSTALGWTTDEFLRALPTPKPRRRRAAHPRQSTHNRPVGEDVRQAIRERHDAVVKATGEAPTVRALAREFEVSAQTVSASLADGAI